MLRSRLRPDQIGAAVEGVGRTGHGFDGESQAAGKWLRFVRGVHLQPWARSVPAHADAGSRRVAQQQSGTVFGVPVDIGERMVDLDASLCPRGPEVEFMVPYRRRSSGSSLSSVTLRNESAGSSRIYSLSGAEPATRYGCGQTPYGAGRSPVLVVVTLVYSPPSSSVYCTSKKSGNG